MSNNYRNIMKGTLLFGGVQIFQIMVSLIRSKMIALFIGAEGMGVSGLYLSSLNIIITIAGLGCNLSGVKYISERKEETKEFYYEIKQISIFYFILGIFGALITSVSSIFLSRLTFQSTNHTLSYIILSVFVLCTLISNGNISILQGLKELKTIAKVNILPSALGLLVSIPIYKFLGINAIVPVIIIVPLFTSIYTSFLIAKICKSKITDNNISVNIIKIISIAKAFISLGIVTVIASLLGNITVYLINMFISRTGSVSDVGLYQAGINLTNQSIGLVFAAMSIDYAPRLFSEIKDINKSNEIINSQGEITVLLTLPILSLMLVFSPLLIKILLSNEFLPLISFIRLLCFGMIFKAVSFCYGYVSFAHGDKKTYFIFEGVYGNLINLILCCIGYNFGNLTGLAWAFILFYLIYLLSVFFLNSFKYSYKITKNLLFITIYSVISLFLVFYFIKSSYKYIVTLAYIVAIINVIISIKLLNDKIEIKKTLIEKLNKKVRS